MLVSLENVDKIYNGRAVLSHINVQIDPGDRIGMIGTNGAGKSTLLKLICEFEEPDSGRVNVSKQSSIGYLAQNTGLFSENTIQEEMYDAFSSLLQIKQEIEACQQKIALTQPNSDSYRKWNREYANLQTVFEQNDGYLIDVKISQVLEGMGFSQYPRDTYIKTLSGGEKTRLAMAKLLLEQPNLLILDEPTNHLDLDALEWLENYLASYPGAVLVVSHDRYFLDQCVEKIWEISQGELSVFQGNYSRYLPQKELVVQKQQKEYRAQQEKIKKLQDYIDRNRARASTAKSAHSRQMALERMERLSSPVSSFKPVQLRFLYDISPVKDVLDVRNIRLLVGDADSKKQLLPEFDLHIMRGEKLAIMGANGIGKSTFLKAIQDLISYEGTVRWGTNVKIGYYQQELSGLNPNNTVLEELWGRNPQKKEVDIRNALAGVGLIGENVYKLVADISGGEKARLCFAVLMQEKPNVLLLDEPTNHLDLPTREALECSLQEYQGTILFVSHDRYFIHRISDKWINFSSDGVHVSDATSDWSKSPKKTDLLSGQPEQKLSDKKSSDKKSERVYRAQYREQMKKLEMSIADLETTIQDLELQLEQPDVYNDYQKANQICEELDLCRKQYEQKFEEWIKLQEE